VSSKFTKPAPGTKVGSTGLAASIVAYYLLGDNAGTVVDSSTVGGNPGTVNSGLTWGASIRYVLSDVEDVAAERGRRDKMPEPVAHATSA
jgi:hypothetical protein